MWCDPIINLHVFPRPEIMYGKNPGYRCLCGQRIYYPLEAAAAAEKERIKARAEEVMSFNDEMQAIADFTKPLREEAEKYLKDSAERERIEAERCERMMHL